MALVKHIDPHNDKHNDSSAGNYCVCEYVDVTVGELLKALTDVSAFVRAKHTHI